MNQKPLYRYQFMIGFLRRNIRQDIGYILNSRDRDSLQKGKEKFDRTAQARNDGGPLSSASSVTNFYVF